MGTQLVGGLLCERVGSGRVRKRRFGHDLITVDSKKRRITYAWGGQLRNLPIQELGGNGERKRGKGLNEMEGV